jgi:hypothetical protein
LRAQAIVTLLRLGGRSSPFDATHWARRGGGRFHAPAFILRHFDKSPRHGLGPPGSIFIIDAMSQDPMQAAEWLERSSCFSLWALAQAPSAGLSVSGFIAQILAIADRCHVYGLVENSVAWNAVADSIVKGKGKGKFELTLPLRSASDPEVFLMDHGGRGTLLIHVPLPTFQNRLFEKWPGAAMVLGNSRKDHTAAAVTFAKRSLESGTHLVFAVPPPAHRVEVFAPKSRLFALYQAALLACPIRD